MADSTEVQLNLYQKLAKIRKPAEIIKKNKRGYNYTYVDEETILAKITGAMDKYGVSLVPGIISGTSTVEPYHYVKVRTTKDGKTYEEHINEVLVHAEMEWIWVNNDNPEERIVVPWFLVGSQGDASQSFGSALTYSSRYFLLKYFNIATSDADPDEYRRRQKEAEAAEDKLVAEKIVEQIHLKVVAYTTENPEQKDAVTEVIKAHTKRCGKATANYNIIDKPDVAAELLKAIDEMVADSAKGGE